MVSLFIGWFVRGTDLLPVKDELEKNNEIPGHSDGLCALKIKNEEGKFVLLFADGGYATKSWEEMILSGVCVDKDAQRKSLEWIREQSMSEECIESLANHDADVIPHNICL